MMNDEQTIDTVSSTDSSTDASTETVNDSVDESINDSASEPANNSSIDSTIDSTIESINNPSTDSFAAMMARVRAFHHKHRFAENGGEDMVYRLALMSEELGEIAACITKGESKERLAEECADLFILLLGNAIAADFDLARAFDKKMRKINQRSARMIDGRVRVSEFGAR